MLVPPPVGTNLNIPRTIKARIPEVYLVGYQLSALDSIRNDAYMIIRTTSFNCLLPPYSGGGISRAHTCVGDYAVVGEVHARTYSGSAIESPCCGGGRTTRHNSNE